MQQAQNINPFVDDPTHLLKAEFLYIYAKKGPNPVSSLSLS